MEVLPVADQWLAETPRSTLDKVGPLLAAGSECDHGSTRAPPGALRSLAQPDNASTAYDVRLGRCPAPAPTGSLLRRDLVSRTGYQMALAPLRAPDR
jgi:hypothetical protein